MIQHKKYLILFIFLLTTCSNKSSMIDQESNVTKVDVNLTTINNNQFTTTSINTDKSSSVVNVPGDISILEGAELKFLLSTENKITDIENSINNDLTLVAMMQKDTIYKLDYKDIKLVEFLKFTDEVDFSNSPEAGIVKILIIESRYLLIAYTNSLMQIIIKQFDLENLEKPEKIIYKDTLIQNVHPCLDMVYDKNNNILYFCRGDSTMQKDEITLQAHMPDGKIHRYNFSPDLGLLPIETTIESNEFLTVFPNTSPKKINSILFIGLRNPYEIHLSEDNLLYIPDVSGGFMEELNIVNLSENMEFKNFGWPIYSGNIPTESNQLIKDMMISESVLENYTNNYLVHSEPFLQYSHYEDTSSGKRCAIIGGTTYFGEKSNVWKNNYIFGDYCSSEVFTLYGEYPNLSVYKLINLQEFITHIGNDINGEILIATENNTGESEFSGNIYLLNLP